MPSQNIQMIEVDGKKYDIDSLSADARTAVLVIEELNGKINGFRKEAHFLEVARSTYESQLIELKRVAFIFEKSGDPEVLEELLDTIRDIEIPLLVAGYHIPHEAEA